MWQCVCRVVLQSRAPLTTVTSSTDMDDKYRQVMMTNAQLDNDKQKLLYEVDLLKDRVADTEEHNTQLEVQLARVSRVCHSDDYQLVSCSETSGEWQ